MHSVDEGGTGHRLPNLSRMAGYPLDKAPDSARSPDVFEGWDYEFVFSK